MRERDAFVKGLRIILANDKKLSPAGLGKKAGLSDSTLRKLLDDEKGIESLTVAKCQDVADVLPGYSLVDIIALGANSNAPDLISIALAFRSADEKVRSQVEAYLEVSEAQRRESEQALQAHVVQSSQDEQ